jgi:hypothetical protein
MRNKEAIILICIGNPMHGLPQLIAKQLQTTKRISACKSKRRDMYDESLQINCIVLYFVFHAISPVVVNSSLAYPQCAKLVDETKVLHLANVVVHLISREFLKFIMDF